MKGQSASEIRENLLAYNNRKNGRGSMQIVSTAQQEAYFTRLSRMPNDAFGRAQPIQASDGTIEFLPGFDGPVTSTSRT